MERNYSSERGQTIIIMVIGIVVLFGFTALAIDGGMAFTQRRHDQNAADAAALAGALQKANGQSDATAILAARNSAFSNGFASDQVSVSVNNNYEDYSGHYILVTVGISSTTKTNFAQFVFGGQLKNVVKAIGRARPSQPAIAKSAIVAMGNCLEGDDHLISVVGGGHTGGVLTFDGGMFVNTPENSSDACAINPPSSSGTPGITAETGFPIYSVGSYDYSGEDHISPVPVDTGINEGVPITDPWSSKDEPTCKANGEKYEKVSDHKTHYRPGYYGGSGQPNLGDGILDPGIFCIRGDIGGNINIDATGGVVLYFINGAPVFHGNGDFLVTAPNSETCLAEDPNNLQTFDSCSYAGFAIFMARSNNSLISLTGNGTYKIIGMVYALNGGIEAKGGGTTGCDDNPNDPSCDWVVKGQVIAKTVAGTGNGSFSVTYDASVLPKLPVQVSLHQ